MGADARSKPPRNLFPRRVRLDRREDYTRVFDANVRVWDERFTMLARPNDLGHPRLGLAVSRKAVANAADRNRLKRLVREHFRLAQHDLPAVDVVVLARPAAAAASAQDLRSGLEKLWQRVTARCKS